MRWAEVFTAAVETLVRTVLHGKDAVTSGTLSSSPTTLALFFLPGFSSSLMPYSEPSVTYIP